MVPIVAMVAMVVCSMLTTDMINMTTSINFKNNTNSTSKVTKGKGKPPRPSFTSTKMVS